mmetsp:Transcript_19215/g.57980  ORF Transcript_19215/g.57980 Transcript_19215/m.57980 type:complete len:327 (-) Transcript_19215:1330-2310(-)|eukprot:CAMPEP_0206141298 /NCGR_PEP_ID=MMETSP1473-20131121/12479_1 /ASSEMBLY_ACC=CAM_ASM_001109 /TAXON_ID=1461547 /ORGANISM="Stichococcus sp, Strain RCC1054" /LENGTH=326 /DNA_ID=CAMNT_0053535811 /DNA_START=274 /DNA_END=1254 /DNA_ORIENTATION=+
MAQKRAFAEGDGQSMDAICRAVKRLHTSSSTLSPEDVFDASIASAAAAVQRAECIGQSGGAQPDWGQGPLHEARQHVLPSDARHLQARPQPLRAVRPTSTALSPLSQRQAAQQQQWQRHRQQQLQGENIRDQRERSALQPSPNHGPQHDQFWHASPPNWQQQQQQHQPGIQLQSQWLQQEHSQRQQHQQSEHALWHQQQLQLQGSPHWQQHHKQHNHVQQQQQQQANGLPASPAVQPQHWASGAPRRPSPRLQQLEATDPQLRPTASPHPEESQQAAQLDAADLAAYEQASNMLRQLHFERLQRRSAPPHPGALNLQLWHRHHGGP